MSVSTNLFYNILLKINHSNSDAFWIVFSKLVYSKAKLPKVFHKHIKCIIISSIKDVYLLACINKETLSNDLMEHLKIVVSFLNRIIIIEPNVFHESFSDDNDFISMSIQLIQQIIKDINDVLIDGFNIHIDDLREMTSILEKYINNDSKCFESNFNDDKLYLHQSICPNYNNSDLHDHTIMNISKSRTYAPKYRSSFATIESPSVQITKRTHTSSLAIFHNDCDNSIDAHSSISIGISSSKNQNQNNLIDQDITIDDKEVENEDEHSFRNENKLKQFDTPTLICLQSFEKIQEKMTYQLMQYSIKLRSEIALCKQSLKYINEHKMYSDIVSNANIDEISAIQSQCESCYFNYIEYEKHINNKLDDLSERIDKCLHQINEIESMITTAKHEYMKEMTMLLYE